MYAGADGIAGGNSAPSSVRGDRLTDACPKSVSLTSTGEAFLGFFVADGAPTWA
ncbi:hypothetical protein [Streptomyces sp. NPDC060002]|uniref:hypothetical protein n=1 Tax=Streptomyces sp. NPDC060002 TaxID=3347033 RepID=UPI0036973289